MKHARMLIEFGTILALAFVAGCGGGGSRGSTASVQASAGALEVDVTQVTTRKLSIIEYLPGELTPYEEVAIYPKTTGFVLTMNVDRGSRVRQGELLAQLEAPELAAQRGEAESKFAAAQSQLASAQARLDADQGTYDRLAAAAKTPGVVAGNDLQIAAKTVDQDRANAGAARNGVRAADEARKSIAQIEDYLKITAPFDGIITVRNVHPGALVGPAGGPGAGTPMLRMETLSRLRLVVPVPERFAADVPVGARVKFTVPAYPTETFEAPVARVSHAIDPKTRTMPIELDVSNSAGRLTPGAFCQVQWPEGRENATHFVPPGAIASNQERTFVIRVAPSPAANAGTAEWVDVKTGASSGNLVEIFGELHDGDRVVLRATDAIRPGTLLAPHLTASPQ